MSLPLALLVFILLTTVYPSYGQNRCNQLFVGKRATNIIEGDVENLFSLRSLQSHSPGAAVSLASGVVKIVVSNRQNASFSFPLRVQKSLLNSWQLMAYQNRQIKGQRAFLTSSENLALTNYPFEKNPFLGALVFHFRGTYLDPLPVLDWAGFNFLARAKGLNGATNANQKIRIYAFFETSLTKQLSLDKQRPIRYETEFLVGPNLDWVSLRLSDFTLSHLEEGPSCSAASHDVLNFGFEIVEDQARPNNLVLELSDKASINLHVNNTEIPHFIDNLFLNHESGFYTAIPGPRPSDHYTKSVLKKFFLNMQNPDLQKLILPIVKKGLPALKLEFQKYGWDIKTQFVKKATMLEIIETISRRDMFYESGDFGPLHGTFSHHAQILTGLKGLSPAEAKLVLDFISYYIAEVTRSSQWPIWNVLFDSRGYGVNGNRYWRDKIDQQTLLFEP